LEVLLVAALLVIISTFSVGMYRNYGVNVQLDSVRKNIIYDLRQIQVRAAAGEDRRNWGAHFVNGAQDYYELFSTPTNYSDAGKATLSIVYLPGTISFIRPAASASQDIIFSSIAGGTTADYVSISAENIIKIINVTVSGAVY